MPSRLFAILVEALEDSYGPIPQQDLARRLGVSPAAVSSWLTGKSEPNAKSIGKLLDLHADHRASALFAPLVEFASIHPDRVGAGWRLAPDEVARLEPQLHQRKGIYVFYDSAGEAAYLGKSARDLWQEARRRLSAEANRPFYTPDKGASRKLGDIARFLSAYEVTVPAAIANVETFMLRAFANDLMNRNSGKFRSLMNHQPAKVPETAGGS
jgi:transcriptional regulator with XRE-family HTH domain